MLGAISSLLYPPVCTICMASVEPNEYLCDDCEAKATRIKAPFCARCSEPFSGAITSTFSCANCEHRTLHFDAAVAAYRSRAIVRRVIHQFKYEKQIYLKNLLARWLDEAFADDRLRGIPFDLVIPVPLHPAKERERG